MNFKSSQIAKRKHNFWGNLDCEVFSHVVPEKYAKQSGFVFALMTQTSGAAPQIKHLSKCTFRITTFLRGLFHTKLYRIQCRYRLQAWHFSKCYYNINSDEQTNAYTKVHKLVNFLNNILCIGHMILTNFLCSKEYSLRNHVQCTLNCNLLI